MGCINWGRPLLLKLAIDNMSSEDLEAPLCCIASDFIEAALRAAKHSNSNTRANILKDVCSMLKCEPEDLGFLFQADLDKNTSQFSNLSLPDYRLNTRDLYLEAAE